MNVIEKINQILKKANVSKVNLASYLGVSRQMVYNYLNCKDMSRLPSDKSQLIFDLLDVKSADEILAKKIDDTYLQTIGNKLYDNKKKKIKKEEETIELEGLNSEEISLIKDINLMLKNLLIESKSRDKEALTTIKYLNQFVQNLNTSIEEKYALAFFSKNYGFTDPVNFAYNERQQYVFESIMFTAINLFNDGGASRSRLAESHRRWEDILNRKKEEKLSRTQELNTAKLRALSELGYNKIDGSNANEVLDKIAEIISRKM